VYNTHSAGIIGWQVAYRRFRQPVERISAVLGRWLRHHKRDGDLDRYTVLDQWPELVGERLAHRTSPSGLKDGVLTVNVANSAWLNELSFMRAAMVLRINEHFGRPVVKAIRLVAGSVRPPPRRLQVEEEPCYVELPPEEVERIDREVDAVSDPELREAIREARLSHLRRMLRFKGG
jgi:hypothetical protein